MVSRSVLAVAGSTSSAVGGVLAADSGWVLVAADGIGSISTLLAGDVWVDSGPGGCDWHSDSWPDLSVGVVGGSNGRVPPGWLLSSGLSRLSETSLSVVWPFNNNSSWWWFGVDLNIGGALGSHTRLVRFYLSTESVFVSNVVDVTENSIGVSVAVAASDSTIVVRRFLSVHDGSEFISALESEIVRFSTSVFLKVIRNP